MAHNIRSLIRELYGDELDSFEQSSSVTVGTTAVRLVRENARRIRCLLVNSGGAVVVLGVDASVTDTTGIPVSPGNAVEFTFQDDYERVGRAIWAVSAAAGNTVQINETVLVPT
jgi:hypothetical protein